MSTRPTTEKKKRKENGLLADRAACLILSEFCSMIDFSAHWSPHCLAGRAPEQRSSRVGAAPTALEQANQQVQSRNPPDQPAEHVDASQLVAKLLQRRGSLHHPNLPTESREPTTVSGLLGTRGLAQHAKLSTDLGRNQHASVTVSPCLVSFTCKRKKNLRRNFANLKY